MTDQDSEMDKISRRLESLELRLSRLESVLIVTDNINLHRSEEQVQTVDTQLNSNILYEEEKGLESKIGRFGLAWLGNIVLLFGIAFLAQYLMNLGYRYLSILLGYFAVASIFFLANYFKKTNVHLAFMFKMNALLLLYYITLKLHFFSVSPVVPDKTISVVILLLLVAFQTYLSIRNKSQAFAALSMLFALTTAITGDATHFMLPLVILTSAGAIYYYYRFNWEPLLVVTIFLTYISFFLWMFGNPFMGHPMQLITEQHYGIIYLFGLGACFSIILLFRKRDASSDDFLTGVTITNGILFTILLLLVVLGFFSTNYVACFAIITICCLIYSTILNSKSDWNFASAFYALYGFMAMSIALYGLFGLPGVYLLLSIQSLIVVSMALWFRNRLIVVMNSILFLTILCVYLLSSKSIDGVNFSFALISLISARIINWKRSRLQIKTDIIRNLYLTEGFLMVLYALFHAVPKHFVTLSWTMAALLYFILSFILKNVKYRYMALGTMICAAFYLFIIDLSRIEIIYRVLALLFLAMISIGISLYYTNRIKKTDS
ncbi:MAG: hypothetical protein NTV31_02020 [Bacteroidia bacterium]|nr:hypothetical protein [Bacteroidia bacterium]